MEIGSNCKRILITLNNPMFANSSLPLNWLFRMRSKEDLDKEQINILKKAFEAFDQEKRGCIGTVMVGTILGMLGHQVSDESLQEIINEVDVDGSGELEFEEFVTLASRFMVEEDAEAMQQELKEAFRLYDKEGNGYITTTVLREILRELDDKISAEELDMMIEEIDSDGSGTVDFDEFMEVMTGGDD
ncbi:troponin C, isoallergen Bla g 6.0101 isoform X1 [Battus philenor]|uniref:troponin C, isoallergen Bla g 6.0101 isoform X1 n=1 Tax=Battus philenor TaxID=42288 RepID=UPI0035CFBEE6